MPIIGGFTGARVTEITQLRKEDIRQEGEHWIARLTPDAGAIKTGAYRDVPPHPQIIAEGFVQFVQDAKSGPLFHNATDPARYVAKATQISNRLSTWLCGTELVTDPPSDPRTHGGTVSNRSASSLVSHRACMTLFKGTPGKPHPMVTAR